MIFSENPAPRLDEFRHLMELTDERLNMDAQERNDSEYYRRHSGEKLEPIVFDAMRDCAIGTSFEGTLKLTAKYKFPDIIAAKLYGVEVKSTIKDHWTSTGSSILESTRIEGVERIYLTFGKLSHKVEFISRPYEECLSGIVVTHMPRYTIDMKLHSDQTIFHKIGIPYDTLRQNKNPVEPVKKYFKEHLLEGESLWWLTDSPAVIKMWNCLSSKERDNLIAYGLTKFIEIFKGDYNNFTLWLAQEQSILCPNVRDQFSASGQGKLPITQAGEKLHFPQVFIRVHKYAKKILEYLKKDGQFQGPIKIDGKDLEIALYRWITNVADMYGSLDNKERTKDEVKSALELIFSSLD